MENTKGPSPLYRELPFVFKTTGAVRRTANAQRYSRKLGQQALRMSRELQTVSYLTIADDKTVYILSRAQTMLIQDNNGEILEDMMLSGWHVYPTSMANIEMLPQLVQQELL